ncbi:MAG TPA: hypothetical protein VIH06_08745, partial [Ilumatobacteraceae bacterium]
RRGSRHATPIVAVLSLLPAAGVACGPTSAYSFAAIDGIELIDGGPNCPKLSVGNDVLYSDCFDKPEAPQFVHEDAERELLLITTSPNYTVTLVDPGFRTVSRSDNYLVLQRSREVGRSEVRFTITSTEEVDWCHITEQHIIRCHRLVFNA